MPDGKSFCTRARLSFIKERRGGVPVSTGSMNRSTRKAAVVFCDPSYGGAGMSEVNTKNLDPEVWRLFDRYVHGLIDRRGFLDGAGKYAVGGVTAVGILEALSPKYAEAQQVAP